MFAVIFKSKLVDQPIGYSQMADEMELLAKQQPGFLGISSVRNELGITVSYWETLEHISLWKANQEHLIAQKLGVANWYDWYEIEICQVLKSYAFQREKGSGF